VSLNMSGIRLYMFGYICRTQDNRKLKTRMFGIIESTNKRSRPCRGWTDDTVSWRKTGLQQLKSLAQDRTTESSDVNKDLSAKDQDQDQDFYPRTRTRT